MKNLKAVVCSLVLAISVNVSAKIIYVDKSAPANGDGTSWSTAYRFLADVIGRCSYHTNGDIILIAEGVYYPDESENRPSGTGSTSDLFELYHGMDITIMGGFEKGGTWNRDINAFPTILSGDLQENDVDYLPETKNDNSRTILNVTHCQGQIYIEGLTFANGNCSYSQQGTLILRDNNKVVFEKCKFINNTGAFYAFQSNDHLRNCEFIQNISPVVLERSSMQTESCIFVDNYSNMPGGVINISGNDSRLCTLDINDCEFMFNESNKEGGAVSIGIYCQVKIAGSNFLGNKGRIGGAVFQERTGSELEIRHTEFRDNVCIAHSAALSGFNFSVYDSKFIGNLCPHSIGGLLVNIGQYSEAKIVNCQFLQSPLSSSSRSLISLEGISLKMEGCLFAANQNVGVSATNTIGSVYISNCTWMNNMGQPFASGNMNGIIENCIIHSQNEFSSTPTLLYFSSQKPTVKNCNIKNCMPNSRWQQLCGIDGGGNFDSDPCFVDPGSYEIINPLTVILTVGDYHLRSQAGRWSNIGWVLDDTTSDSIDAGNVDSDLGNELFPNGGRINLGCYGGTMQASKTYFQNQTAPCEKHLAADINGDCLVDFRDLAILTRHWLTDNRHKPVQDKPVPEK